MKSICLTTTQVRTMIDKCESVLFLTIEEQPEIISQGALLRSCGIDAILINPRTGESMVDTDCPFVVGERRWVAEEWVPTFHGSDCLYRADETGKDIFLVDHWKSAASMPFERRRRNFTVKVVAVKTMQIQDTSFEDCRAAGCDTEYVETVERCPGCTPSECNGTHYGERWHFKRLWNSAHAKPEEKWGANPWCWKISLILEENIHAK